MHRTWIEVMTFALAYAAVAGCTTNKQKLLPHGATTMQDVWNQNTSAGAEGPRTSRQLIEAREALRRPLTAAEMKRALQAAESYTRTAQNEITRQFHRLPNPDLVLYVFPHLTGEAAAPVPGYSTVFPFYERVEYAMPGERVEDY